MPHETRAIISVPVRSFPHPSPHLFVYTIASIPFTSINPYYYIYSCTPLPSKEKQITIPSLIYPYFVLNIDKRHTGTIISSPQSSLLIQRSIDRFFSRDLPDVTSLRSPMPSSSSSSSSRPLSAVYFSRPPSQPDLRPYNPPIPPDLSGALMPSLSIDPVRKITPPEEHRSYTDEKLVVAEDVYKQAERYVEEYRAWIKPSPGQYLPRPLEYYETPLRIKMSVGDWIKLDRKLNLDENDDL